MNILVTGGAGYIGSHAALRLITDGHAVTVIDNLDRGHAGAIEALQRVGDLHFVEGSVGDRSVVGGVLAERKIDLVMHFAALTYVGESMDQPLAYYRNNTANAMVLLEAIEAAGVQSMVFSSTCATYGEPPPDCVPIDENCPQQPINPYGSSKLMTERMLFDFAATKAARGEPFGFVALRYFNVAGNDRQGRIGEDHRPETHLIPLCLDAVLGRRPQITVFGDDYPTPDGTCVRDYVQVEDLIDAHVTAMQALKPGDTRTYNVGIGNGYSVREVIDACSAVTGKPVPTADGSRRRGDPPSLYANPAKIKRELGWTASITDLHEIIESAYRWRADHPEGYG